VQSAAHTRNGATPLCAYDQRTHNLDSGPQFCNNKRWSVVSRTAQKRGTSLDTRGQHEQHEQENDEQERRALAEWAEQAQRIDETLELAVAFEPATALTEGLFGLDDAQLRRVVAYTLARVQVTEPVELSVLITGDDGLRSLNREYRGRDEATDVLSFPLRDEPLVQAPENQLWLTVEETAQDGESGEDGHLADTEDASAFSELDDEPLSAEGDEDDEGEDNEGEDEEDAGEWEDDEATFPSVGVGALHLGDIALSRDAIVRQAAQAGHSAAWELAYLLAHGVLHLVGYDDQTDAGYQAMVAHQEAVLAQVGIAR